MRVCKFAVLLCGIALLTAAPIQTWAQEEGRTNMRSAATDILPPVDVRGRKRSPVYGAVLPSADAPKSATCEYWVQTDILVRAQVGAANGDPMMGPTFYQPTRETRNPDYNASPKTAPGSELPAVKSLAAAREITASMRGASTKPLFDDSEFEGSNDTLGIGDVFGGCRTGAYKLSDGPFSTFGAAGRLESAYRDTTLRMGSALFDEGRYAEALTYYKQAYAKLDDQMGGDEAALMIGKIYMFGLREKSDPKEALVWLKKSANVRFKPATSMPQFDPLDPHRNTASGEASVILANVYLGGVEGIAADPKEARKWFERARYVGHIPAAKILGDFSYYGIGGPKDQKRAFTYYKEAATYGYAPAQYALAQMYRSGEGVGADIEKALGWYAQAARLDHPGATYALARAYDLGDGVAADPQKAIAFYKTSALGGNIAAQAALGTYFYEGKLVSKDDAAARKWFETAAVAGDADAMFNLGVMTMKGEGGEADLTKAWVWFRMSQTGGVEAAPAAVAAIEKRMTSEQLQAARAVYNPAKS